MWLWKMLLVSVTPPVPCIFFFMLVFHSLPHLNLPVPLFPFNIFYYCVLSHFPGNLLHHAFLLISWLLSIFQIEYTALKIESFLSTSERKLVIYLTFWAWVASLRVVVSNPIRLFSDFIISFSLAAEEIHHCVNGPHFHFADISCWPPKLFPLPGCSE